MNPDRFLVSFSVSVTRFGTSNSFRAATKIGTRSFVAAARENPLEALRQLFRQLSGDSGAWGDDVALALDLALIGINTEQDLAQLTEGTDG